MSYPPDSSGSLSVIDRLVAGTKPLPPVAHILVQLQGLLADPNSGMEDIANLIRLDAGLMTRIIRISNSVWFKRGVACESIEEAVNRVGFREVYRAVALVVSDAIVAQPLVVYRRDAAAMWRESVACAFAAELLAERLGEEMPVAYMCGMLHAIGRLPIDQYLLAGNDTAKPLADEGFPLEQSGAEYAALGCNQAEVGARLLAKWEFPRTLIPPVRHQYEPLETQEPDDRMAAVLYGARALRTIVAQHVPAEELSFDEEVLGVLRLSPGELLELVPAVQEQFERAAQVTKV